MERADGETEHRKHIHHGGFSESVSSEGVAVKNQTWETSHVWLLLLTRPQDYDGFLTLPHFMLSDQDYLGKAGLLLIAVLVRWFTATFLQI
jgi:hypothetical protein